MAFPRSVGGLGAGEVSSPTWLGAPEVSSPTCRGRAIRQYTRVGQTRTGMDDIDQLLEEAEVICGRNRAKQTSVEKGLKGKSDVEEDISRMLEEFDCLDKPPHSSSTTPTSLPKPQVVGVSRKQRWVWGPPWCPGARWSSSPPPPRSGAAPPSPRRGPATSCSASPVTWQSSPSMGLLG